MIAYQKAKELLFKASSERGFLASAHDITNYRRIWARDGVICGLAALLDEDAGLVNTFKETLISLGDHQHEVGTIPSNVFFDKDEVKVSYGGLAGRVDTISWFIIGICNYAYFTNDIELFRRFETQIKKGLELLNAWEFNNQDLLYVPRSGNWADEYVTEGHILYDQLLRVWALRCYKHFVTSGQQQKIDQITYKIDLNYRKNDKNTNPYHPKAFSELDVYKYWAASINPSGYQTMFDAFANALALLLDLGDHSFQENVIKYTESLRDKMVLKLLPAFWPPIQKGDLDWTFLENNCKYEFRNYPFVFHNGGTWQMVNGFYSAALSIKGLHREADNVLAKIDQCNKAENWGFYENFNTKNGEVNGVPNCTWSAAASIIAFQYSKGKRFLM